MNSFKFDDNFKSLTLNDALEQGLRENFDQQIRKIETEQLELNWRDSEQAFWYPTISLNLASSTQRVGTLRDGDTEPVKSSNLPSGTLSLDIEDYTVFNWGKDYLAFLNTKETYQRGKQQLDEKKRDLRHEIITKYFETIYYRQVEKIKKSQLRHASFLYSMNREKVTLKKVSKREYYQARSEYLRAQNEFYESRLNTSKADESLAKVLKDPAGTRYLFRERLKYLPVKTTLEEATKIAKKENTDVKDSRVGLHISNRNLDITKRDNLPLPKFTMNLGAYTHTFGRSAWATRYGTGSSAAGTANDTDIELVATVNATWTISGSGGLFNSRKTRLSHIDKLISTKKLEQAKHCAESDVRGYYHGLEQIQNEMKVLGARTVSLQKMFDTSLEDYLSKKGNFQDFRQSLIEMTETDVLYELTKFLHLKEKVNLVNTMGLEDFPGENFEDLAIKEKGK
ncbi:MAG: TolC family protein [Bacteriovoracaceae bacterium]|nr:TolC family protein [Bacteriovoracaceae bacterium]